MTSNFDVRDLIIKGRNDNTLKVHRCMILARAPEFFNELSQKWIERDRKFYVTVDSIDWIPLFNFIRYLYFDTIAVEPTGDGGSFTTDEANTIAKIRDLASTYHIERLEKLCSFKLGEQIEVPDSTTAADLSTIFNRDDTSDVRLKIMGIADKTIPAHKCILATRCPYFKGMFESGMEESEISEIEIEETTEKAFMQLLEYLYTDSIDDLDGETAMEVYALANRYALDHLQALCEQVIRESVDESNVEAVKMWAEEFQNPNLAAFCTDKMKQQKDAAVVATAK